MVGSEVWLGFNEHGRILSRIARVGCQTARRQNGLVDGDGDGEINDSTHSPILIYLTNRTSKTHCFTNTTHAQHCLQSNTAGFV